MATKSSKRSKGPAPAPKRAAPSASPVRWAVVGALVVVVAFGAYRVLSASSRPGPVPVTTPASAPAASTAPGGAKVTGAEVSGTAVVAGGIQKISVDITTGIYNPNILHLKADVPAEITFSQGRGCTSTVHSQELGFSEDLSAGPKTVRLGGLKPGTYGFSCGMNMVFGRVVVE